jgi:hypothetical protein
MQGRREGKAEIRVIGGRGRLENRLIEEERREKKEVKEYVSDIRNDDT